MTFALPSPEIKAANALDAPDAELFPVRGCKRKRSMPILTPPSEIDDEDSQRTLNRAIHVLSTEAKALAFIAELYRKEATARNGLLQAVETIVKVNEAHGKLLVCGIGKSGFIGMKIVATMKSLGLASSFLHAAEAMHGDLGDIRPNDAIMFITFSGKTPELIGLLSHIRDTTPIIVLTAHTSLKTCPLLLERTDGILLPAPIPESEETSFGVSAPTTSTTVALAVGDMLALTMADRIHQHEALTVFMRNHPGGAIGAKR